jgi:hypothetical protein
LLEQVGFVLSLGNENQTDSEDRMTDWRTIETAPKDGTRILVPYPRFKAQNNTNVPDEYEVQIVYWKGNGWDLGWWKLHEDPTHWQPLPEPPKT